MWKLAYRKDCLDSWTRKVFLLKKSLISRILILREHGYEDIFITTILSREEIEKSSVYVVEYQERNIKGWHYTFFCKEKQALEFIRKLKRAHYDYYDLTVILLADLLHD